MSKALYWAVVGYSPHFHIKSPAILLQCHYIGINTTQPGKTNSGKLSLSHSCHNMTIPVMIVKIKKYRSRMIVIYLINKLNKT